MLPLLKLTSTGWLLLVLLTPWIGASALAQPLTPTINPNTTPITINQAPEKIAVRSKLADQKLVNIAFGATVNDGNSKSYAGNLGGRFGLIRGPHQLTLEALGTLGGSRQGSLTDVEWNARTLVARARYDRFLSLSNALFVAVAPRRDYQAGIDLRLQNQAGYLRNLFYFNDSHRLWTEVGYDFTYDNFAPFDEEDRAKAAMEGTRLEPTHLVHSARLFFGYTNRLSPSANLSVGVETLADVQNRRNVRVTGLSELTSSITQSFKLGLQSRVLFDNLAEQRNKEKYDLIVVAQLVYTFDSAAGTAQQGCPVCDCSAAVEAARASCKSPSAGKPAGEPAATPAQAPASP